MVADLDLFIDGLAVVFGFVAIPLLFWLWRYSKGGIFSKPLGFLAIAYTAFGFDRLVHFLADFYGLSAEFEVLEGALNLVFIAGIVGLTLMIMRRVRELSTSK